MSIEGQTTKCEAVELILRPSDGRDGDIRRADLLRQPETDGHFVAGLERSLSAHPCAAQREIVYEPPVSVPSSQPSPWPDR